MTYKWRLEKISNNLEIRLGTHWGSKSNILPGQYEILNPFKKYQNSTKNSSNIKKTNPIKKAHLKKQTQIKKTQKNCKNKIKNEINQSCKI